MKKGERHLRRRNSTSESQGAHRGCPEGLEPARGTCGGREPEHTCGQSHRGLVCRPRRGLSYRNQLPTILLGACSLQELHLKCCISQRCLQVRVVTNTLKISVAWHKKVYFSLASHSYEMSGGGGRWQLCSLSSCRSGSPST